MKQKIKEVLHKIIRLLIQPLFDEYLVALSRQDQILLSLKYRELVQTQDKGLDFEQVGFNLYSPTYEDGILLYIFSLIGTTNKKCVDIGAGSVKGSTVANLIVNHGFKGLLIDGNSQSIQLVKKYYANHPETRFSPPQAVSAMITAENVNELLNEYGYVGNIDLLCLDIDGMDYWILKAIDVVSPQVLVVEYQDILGPDKAWTVPYKPDFNLQDYPVNRKENNYCGASLSAFVSLCKHKGYRLVGCNKGGWNAFFVREGVCEAFLPEVTPESCFKYEWNRYGMEKRFPLVMNMEWEEVC
ncbi:MAG: hypothetical protein ACOYYU_13045 [Chloroflexota bacterium]